MIKPKTYKTFIISILVVCTFSSCKKDKVVDDKDTMSVRENAMAEAAFNDVANIADEAATGSLQSYRGDQSNLALTACATVTIDTVSTPKRITIDFGAVDVLCKDGNYRRGKILVDYIGKYRDSASVHTLSFDNYYVNYNKLGGTKTVTNNGRKANGYISFSVSINGTVTWDAQYGGGTSTHISNRTREWIDGEHTILVWNDDVYLITGTASGVTRTGNNYTMNVIMPLRKRIGFRHFTSGIVEFTPSGKATRTIDYGYVNGAEDNLANVTIAGSSFTIILR